MVLEDKRMADVGAFKPLDGDPNSASRQLAVALRDSFEDREKSTGYALSLGRCAEQAGSSRSTIWRLIHGKAKEPKESVVLRIHAVLTEGVAEAAYSAEEISGYVKEVLEETRRDRLGRRSARSGGQHVG
jgi:transcriptional regulator with XRE-family HTH domain